MKWSPWRFWRVIGSVWCYLLACHSTAAQIVPDGTLPANSIITPQGNTSLIEGGTTAGSNLFHSFREFSVPTGTTAYFNNAVDIQNIFTRITGSNISNIDGLIKANGVANLFLLNPNGIIFGSNARLNIGGSFLATTAASYRFDGVEFSATHPQTAPILTVNVPIGLQLGSNPGQIVNRSRVTANAADGSALPVGLQVQPGRSLTLVGGDIQLERGLLTANAGTIELGSVKDSFVSLSPNLTLGYQNAGNFGDIQLSEGAGVITSGIGGGSIQLRAGKVSLQQGSTLVADTLGNVNGGGINIKATQLSLADGSYISTTTFGEGKGGDITVSATEKVELIGTGVEKFQQSLTGGDLSGSLLPINQLTALFAGTVGEGAAGNISMEVPKLSLQNGAWIGNDTLNSAKAGNLSIRAVDFVELVGSGITTAALFGSAGSSGEIVIDTRRLIIRDASYIATTTFGSGKAGSISIKATESVELLRTPDGSVVPTLIASNSFGRGNGGDITIDTQRLIIRDGAGISSASGGINNSLLLPGGIGGSLNLKATEEVEVSGISEVLADTNPNQIGSFLTSATVTSFPGGNISITTQRLTVKDGGLISTATLNAGKAGDLTINADRSVEIVGATRQFRSTIEASSASAFGFQNRRATGDGGSITVIAPKLIVSDRGVINVSSVGSGKAGTLRVVADAMRLSNEGSINASTGAGAGGNIILQTQSLQLRRQSQINTNAGSADGGNIDINTDTLAALENSDITANALSGRGGRITITARGIFGATSRSRTELQTLLNPNNLDPSQLPTSDITAISQQDAPQLQGSVTINTPDVNPGHGLVDLPENTVDTTSLVASSCSRTKQEGSSFIVTGRGGLPPNPTDPLDVEATWVDLRIITLPLSNREHGDRPIVHSQVPPTTTQIVEASGWKYDRDGKVVLTANVPSMPPSLTHPTCATSS